MKMSKAKDLIREINERERRIQILDKAQYPQVGIFYVINSDLYSDTTPTKEAEDYGDFRTHPYAHCKFWNLLTRHVLKKDIDTSYDFYPRGRVVYNKVKDHYILYLDRCLIKNKQVINKIIREFHLRTRKYSLEDDEHYVCSRCRKGWRD
jgi:hypothetical protein